MGLLDRISGSSNGNRKEQASPQPSTAPEQELEDSQVEDEPVAEDAADDEIVSGDDEVVVKVSTNGGAGDAVDEESAVDASDELDELEAAVDEAEAEDAVEEVEESDQKSAGEPEEADEPKRLKAEDLVTPDRPTKKSKKGKKSKKKAKQAEVIAFANQKGGVAKTTTTLNLAVAFSESGHRVLCIDLDPQGNLTMSQGVDPDQVDKSMYDVLVDHAPISEVIEKREIDIAVASIDLAGAEIAMSTQIGRERALEKALEEVIGDYDFVCIDTPPSLGLLTINALTAADKVIVPVQCEYLSMRGLVQLQNTLQMIRENLNPDVKIEGILPTMLDSRTVHAKEAIEILEENFGELVFKSRIRKAIKFAEAPVRGSSVLKYDPHGKAAEYYRELAEEVLTNGKA
jgi:chromosome partitioning protein